MNYPTWADAGIPISAVYALKTVGSSTALSALIEAVVFQSPPRISTVFVCKSCEHRMSPSKNEVIETCKKCRSYYLVYQPISYYEARYEGRFSPSFCDLLCLQMKNNYVRFFNKPPPITFIQCGWLPNPFVQMEGGERCDSTKPHLAFIRACLCCPYLWTKKPDVPRMPILNALANLLMEQI